MTVSANGSGRRLRVLVLDEGIPYPPNAGKSIRTWNLLRRLASRHSVCMLCYGHPNAPGTLEARNAGIDLRLVEPRADPEGWGLYARLFLNLFSVFPYPVTKHYSHAFQTQCEELLNTDSWDLIQCEWTPYARFIAHTPKAPVLMATHNVESQIWARRAKHSGNPFAKLFFRSQEWKMRRFEKRALLLASAATVVTNLELSTLRSWGVTNINLVPNGVDLESRSTTPEAEAEEELLFLASLDWYPNLDALGYFVKNILSTVRARRPGVKLRIVGRKPAKSVIEQYSCLPGIDFVGEVKEVASYVGRATVIIVPLRIGGGSRLKILEALAAGKAVISTTIGAEGLDVISGEHLLIADSPEEFAGAVEELLASPRLRRLLGNNGRKLVTERYGWDQIASRLEKVWYDVSEHQTALQGVPVSPLGLQVTQ
jgi:glycosyltransferase involved in cell wall biosynthesis